nr:M17 family peptidase N-terminal domain-containing protein [Acinetobacter sp. Marseille-Q1620]
MAVNIKRQSIGKYQDLHIEIITWDSVSAEVELSCACLFHHEVGRDYFIGGLADLDHALGGQLRQIREDGYFNADLYQTLLLDQPQTTLKAPNALLIGMGNPEDLSVEKIGNAVSIAFKTANQLGLESVAFAPGILDTGITPLPMLNQTMLQALKTAWETHHYLHQKGLVKQATVKHWVFDAGEHNFEDKAQEYVDLFFKVFK